MIYDFSIFRTSAVWRSQCQNKADSFEVINNLPENKTRIIKTHLSIPLLPTEIWTKKPKIIYITREVKDVIVSRYHFSKAVGFISKDMLMEQYINLFLDDRPIYSPYWDHVLDF